MSSGLLLVEDAAGFRQAGSHQASALLSRLVDAGDFSRPKHDNCGSSYGTCVEIGALQSREYSMDTAFAQPQGVVVLGFSPQFWNGNHAGTYDETDTVCAR